MTWVIVIPKEGWARGAAPALLLVWHQLFRIFFEKRHFKKKLKTNFFLEKSVSYQKKGGCGPACPSFFLYDNDSGHCRGNLLEIIIIADGERGKLEFSHVSDLHVNCGRQLKVGDKSYNHSWNLKKIKIHYSIIYIKLFNQKQPHGWKVVIILLSCCILVAFGREIPDF